LTCAPPSTPSRTSDHIAICSAGIECIRCSIEVSQPDAVEDAGLPVHRDRAVRPYAHGTGPTTDWTRCAMKTMTTDMRQLHWPRRRVRF
jgi:hypothetical protein